MLLKLHKGRTECLNKFFVVLCKWDEVTADGVFANTMYSLGYTHWVRVRSCSTRFRFTEKYLCGNPDSITLCICIGTLHSGMLGIQIIRICRNMLKAFQMLLISGSCLSLADINCKVIPIDIQTSYLWKRKLWTISLSSTDIHTHTHSLSHPSSKPQCWQACVFNRTKPQSQSIFIPHFHLSFCLSVFNCLCLH